MEESGFAWRRCLAWTLAIGGHAFLLVALSVPWSIEPPRIHAMDESSPAPDFERTARVALPPSRDMPLRASRRTPAARNAIVAPSPVSPSAARQAFAQELAPAPIDPIEVTPVPRPTAYLDDAARARLPDEPLFASKPPPREGDWYTPGEGSEDDMLYRPRALEPNTTRFAKVWRPTQTLGGEWYERLVRATTGKVSIPLNPKFTLVCGASIAGLGGGCAIVRVGAGRVVVERSGEPPPWERVQRVQCRELRDELAEADGAERVAYLLDRLAALCVDAGSSTPETTTPETTKPGESPGSVE